MCFMFSAVFNLKHLVFQRDILNMLMFSHKVCIILAKLEIFLEILIKCINIKFCDNSAIESRVVSCAWTDRETDMTNLILAIRCSTGRLKGNSECIRNLYKF